jgi:hypothetical protein
MFLRHFALALAAKQVAPRPSLGTLLLPAQLAHAGRSSDCSHCSTSAPALGPPPPSVTALAVSGLLGWPFVAWAYWIDRHRAPVSG